MTQMQSAYEIMTVSPGSIAGIFKVEACKNFSEEEWSLLSHPTKAM